MTAPTVRVDHARMTDATDPVVTVAVTRSHGQIIRWFWDLAAAEHPASALLTASQRGVTVTGYLTDLPPGWVDAAVRAHATLKADPKADLSMMATHVNRGPSNGPLIPRGKG